MKAFLAIMCFALITTAASIGGYNYPPGKPAGQQNFRLPTHGGNSGIYSGQLTPPLAAFNGQSPPLPKQNYGAPAAPSPQYQPQHLNAPSQLYGQPSSQSNAPSQLYGQPSPQSNAPSQLYSQPSPQSNSNYAHAAQPHHNPPLYNNHAQQQTIISKDIYLHSAPEEYEEINPEQGQEPPIRKNYRIVFIKAPSQNIKLNVPKRIQATNEEKTIIYVLSKKPDITTIQNQVVQAEQKPHKPEVYFIKYKTQEEANRAQKEIQAQYDALGGATIVSDEGIAPVTSVIGGGSLNSASAGSAFGGNQQNFGQSAFSGSQGSASSIGFGAEGPNRQYLPVKKR